METLSVQSLLETFKGDIFFVNIRRVSYFRYLFRAYLYLFYIQLNTFGYLIPQLWNKLEEKN